ncbi:MAG TPA: response regulator [Spirochaetota bacterium]|nr:response regulator [Spirochaetota bacterium]HPJ35668.1 response regulator [Spirochaetota bacterium]
MAKKLLIIDDEDIVLKSCIRILRNEDYEIDTAYSGEEGLNKIDENKYDLVITDLMMPGMSGMDVLRNVKERKLDLIVVIFTGYATAETAREALKMGAFDYIPKPFTPEEFRDVIHNAIKSGEGSEATMLDLMAIVSHELKSPVSVVHTTAQTLAKGYFGNLEPKQKEILETIIRNCQYLEDIIRSYIDLSKMELDDLEAFNQKVNLVDDVVNGVLEIPEYSSNMKQMPIITDFKIKPVIQGDPNLLQIVITNLVNNAIKYGREKTEIKISVYDKGGDIIFSIYNQGVGISKEDIDTRLFSKFGRLRQKGTEGVKGSGLGLYICRKIIEKHNGKMWVESVPGEYVNFFFSIPASA